LQIRGFEILNAVDKPFEAQEAKALVEPLNARVDDRVLFRLYQDSRPHCLEVAPLQKGLVMVFNGMELVEEGMGFGVPVVKYNNKTYFSSSAYCSINDTESGIRVSKLFFLDTISRKNVAKSFYLNDTLYRLFHSLFEKVYLGSKRSLPFFSKIMELRQVMGIQTKFIKVEPKGAIVVNFLILPTLIKVQVDLSSLDKVGCEEILVLNEQGSTFFSKYSDSEGLKLSDAKIGAWDKVKAENASLAYVKGSVVFSLEKQNGSLLFRGWEKTRGRFAWTGLSYSLPPKVSLFEYVIRLKNAK
jgi:hypothetical protein